LLEGDEGDRDRAKDEDEQQASQFAGDVLLEGRAEELAHLAAKEAGGDIPRLKSTLPRVAAREQVPVGALANYMAFRLSLEGQNWWGTATALQAGGNGWDLARDALLQHLQMSKLAEPDRELLGLALEG